MSKLTAYIVGMHFRPPAKDAVAMCPPGTRLLIQREPTNEYDEYAVKVFLPGFNENMPGKAGEICKLIKDGGGYGLELFPEDGMLHIAYVDSKKTGLAKLFSQDMLTEQKQYEDTAQRTLSELLFEAEMVFDLAGKPQVATELVVAQEQYEVDRAAKHVDRPPTEREAERLKQTQDNLGKPLEDDDIPF